MHRFITLFLKKTSVFLLLIIVLCFVLTSCQKKQETIDNVIAIGFDNNQIYLINDQNQRLLLDYSSIQENLSEFMFVVKKGQYGYINIKGQEIIKPKYQKAYQMAENKAVVILDNKTLIIDNTGNTLFTFPSDVSSISYFSNNRLIVSKNEKYGYLSYQKETNSFVLPSSYDYDYAGVYKEEMAVVGLESTTTDEDNKSHTIIKYNYINLINELLFTEYTFSQASSFSSGLAKVGNIQEESLVELDIKGVPTGHYSKKNINVYHYINKNGEFLRNANTDEVLSFHYGSDANNEIVTTAVYKYLSTSTLEDPYFKSYTFYDLQGNEIYASCFQYTATQNVNIFWPTDLLKMGNRHIFSYAKQSVSWRLFVADNSYDKFLSINIVIKQDEEWVDTIAKDNFIKKETIITNSLVPFYMSNLKYPSFTTSKNPIAIVQVNINDFGKYGVIQVTYDENIDNQEDDPSDGYSANYLIPPIYDRIIY